MMMRLSPTQFQAIRPLHNPQGPVFSCFNREIANELAQTRGNDFAVMPDAQKQVMVVIDGDDFQQYKREVDDALKPEFPQPIQQMAPAQVVTYLQRSSALGAQFIARRQNDIQWTNPIVTTIESTCSNGCSIAPPKKS
jgi:hypothetical protein